MGNNDESSFKRTVAIGIRSEFKKRAKGNVLVDRLNINDRIEVVGVGGGNRHKEGERSNNYLVSLVPNGRRFILYCTNRYNNIPSCFLVSLESCHMIVDGPELKQTSNSKLGSNSELGSDSESGSDSELDNSEFDCKNLEIIPVKHRYSLPLFNGSILEGVLLGKNFIILDTSFLAGQHLESTTLDSRVEEIKYLLDKHYVDDPYISEYKLSVLNYFQNTYTNRRALINELKVNERNDPSEMVLRGKLMYTSLLYNGEIIID